MSTAIRRKPLTDAVLAAIRGLTLPDSTPMLAEVGSMPLGAGWGTSQPNDPLGPGFAPYYVLTTMTAVPSQDAGSLAAPQEDWHIPYMVQSFGVAHQQAEWAGDEARTALGTGCAARSWPWGPATTGSARSGPRRSGASTESPTATRPTSPSRTGSPSG
jgi:hypothetical protein